MTLPLDASPAREPDAAERAAEQLFPHTRSMTKSGVASIIRSEYAKASPELRGVCREAAKEILQVALEENVSDSPERAAIIERHVSAYLAQREAADKARIEELEEQADRYANMGLEHEGRAQKLEAQVARLREALEIIANAKTSFDKTELIITMDAIAQKARAALAEKD